MIDLGTRHARGFAIAWVIAIGLIVFSSTRTLAQTPGGPVQITMGERGAEYFFEPNQVTVPAGQVRFVFRSEGQRNHNWVLRLPGGDVRIPDVSAGRTHEQTFTLPQPGTYQAICDLPTHAQRGMTMTVTVTGEPVAGAPAPPAAQPPAAAQPAPAAPITTFSPAGYPMFVSLAIHIPSAIAWLGIVLYQAIIVAVPFLSPAQRGSLLRRPKWLVLITIPLFMVTGIYQTIYNPFSTITSYEDLSYLRTETAYGIALFWKHAFVAMSVTLTLAVTFWFAPRLVAFANDTRPEATTPSRIPALLTWTNVTACIALLICVAVMVFQLH